jgi:hypothetical protein
MHLLAYFSVVLKIYSTIVGQNRKTNDLLCRCVVGVPAVVGVTAPPDFLVRRLLKKLANAPSFVVRFGSLAGTFLTKETLRF